MEARKLTMFVDVALSQNYSNCSKTAIDIAIPSFILLRHLRSSTQRWNYNLVRPVLISRHTNIDILGAMFNGYGGLLNETDQFVALAAKDNPLTPRAELSWLILKHGLILLSKATIGVENELFLVFQRMHTSQMVCDGQRLDWILAMLNQDGDVSAVTHGHLIWPVLSNPIAGTWQHRFEPSSISRMLAFQSDSLRMADMDVRNY